jgi:hypothetical protein
LDSWLSLVSVINISVWKFHTVAYLLCVFDFIHIDEIFMPFNSINNIFLCIVKLVFKWINVVILNIVYLEQLIQRIVFLCVCITVFYLQQIWLHQNITQKLAFVYINYKVNLFYRIFVQTAEYTVDKTSVSVSPAQQFHGKVSKRFTVYTFYINF